MEALLLLLALVLGAGECMTQCINKTELDACLGRIAPQMPRSGLPVSKEELGTMCRAFKGGMRCVDGYTAQCLSEVERAGLEEHLKGARSTLAFLCDDPVFQKEYLSHANCIRDIQEDWDRCHQHFKYQVHLAHVATPANTSTHYHRDHKVCCIRATFLSCVYRTSFLKCGKTQAVFLKKVTATLSYSDVHQEKCGNLKILQCSVAAPLTGFRRLVQSGVGLCLLLPYLVPRL